MTTKIGIKLPSKRVFDSASWHRDMRNMNPEEGK